MKHDIVKTVQEVFGSKNLLKELNATFLVLIPKFPRAKTMEKFWLFILYNSFYKIISKVLTLRMLETANFNLPVAIQFHYW